MNKTENKISLNGLWNYITDPHRKYSPDEIRLLVEKKKFSGKMSVPTNWQIGGLNNYSGIVWFTKEFDAKNLRNIDGYKTLHFNGVDYFADVWLNWKYLGHHEGYFQPFKFVLDEKNFSVGINLLIVKVDSPKEEPGTVWPDKKKLIKGIFNHHDCRPGAWSLKYGQDKNTGGIWSDVFISFGNKIDIDGIKITPRLNWKNNYADVKVELSTSSKTYNTRTVEFTFDIISPDGKTISKEISLPIKEEKKKYSFSFKIKNPQLWWNWDLGSQNLYTIKLSSEYFCNYLMQFGIREVRLDAKQQFFINNKRLFLRGTNIIPTQYLSELNKTKIDRLVTLLREANINIVRVHAHVNRRELYDAFDKAGIMVWQDFALQWTYEESKKFTENAVSQIRDMVSLLFNHPTIAVWCCHNEPGGQINTLDKKLYDAVWNEDKTRIVRIASNYEEHPYEGWYWGHKERYAATPMGPLVTEFGAQGIPSVQTLEKFLSAKEIIKPDCEKWAYHDFQYEQTFFVAGIEKNKNINQFINNSQNYQADLIKSAINFYRRKKFNPITGVFQFMFSDCWPSITWSVVDYFGKKKKGFYALKEAFNPVSISVEPFQTRFFVQGKLLTDVWIINDLYKNFRDCELRISVGNILIKKMNKINIEENGIYFIDHKRINVSFPAELKSGRHKIRFQFVDKSHRQLITESVIDVELFDKNY
jgi:beta-mannosidase